MSKRDKDLSKRFAWNFIHYLGRLLRRLGFSKGAITVTVCDHRLRPVQVTTSKPKRADSIGPPTASRDELHDALQARLERLLRHSSLRYGEIVIRVNTEEIRDEFRLAISVLVRPDEIEALSDALFVNYHDAA